jgi:hypothetical protein
VVRSGVALNQILRRRWTGGILLFGALALLALAETLFKSRISALSMLLIYLVCFLLAGSAMIIALADARAVAQRTLQEQRRLVDDTLEQIQVETELKRGGSKMPQGKPADGDRGGRR